MGSPITTWENVQAYFTGYGGDTVEFLFVLAVAACLTAIVMGHRHETEAYNGLD